MSRVRLSTGSPTLERMDAARLAEQPKPSACRSLFGPVEHHELKRELTEHLKKMEEAAAEKWDFNFSTHSPRPGNRFIWELLDSKDLPGFYSGPERPVRSLCPPGNTGLDLNGNREESDKPAKRKRSQPCPDSSCQTKRPRTCLDEAPHTPKKCSPPRPS